MNKKEKGHSEILTVYFTLTLLLWALFYLIFPSPRHDVVQYITAHRAFQLGINSYIPENVLAIQKTFASSPEAVMFWAPPWLLLPLYPIFLAQTLSSQWILFLGVAACFFSLQTYLGTKISSNFFIGLTSALTAATYSALAIGNAGFIPASRFSLFLYGIKKKSTLVTAIGITFASTKPHLFLALGIVFAITESRFAYACVKDLIVVLAVTLILSFATHGIQSHGYWIQSIFESSNSPGAVDKASWMCANLDGFLRTLRDTPYEFRLTLNAALNILFVFYITKFRNRINMSLDLIWLTPLCLFIAPYGWLYDAAAIQICIAMGLSVASTHLFKGSAGRVTLAYLSLQGIVLAYLIFFAAYQHQFWWYTPLHAILGYFVLKTSGGKQDEKA